MQMRDMRKRKRMVSNRESARRSRVRKQKLLDDLTAQMNNLTAENHHLLANINLLTHLYFNVESENSVLRAHLSDLDHRLRSLNQIIMEAAPQAASSFQHHDQINAINTNGSDDFFNPCSWGFNPSHDVLLY